jgi:hypothetical protein
MDAKQVALEAALSELLQRARGYRLVGDTLILAESVMR